jgi:hypothetical protein
MMKRSPNHGKEVELCEFEGQIAIGNEEEEPEEEGQGPSDEEECDVEVHFDSESIVTIIS